MSIHVIANLMLDEQSPQWQMLLLKQLSAWLGKVEALYIVGNLFATWVGDDDRHHAYEDTLAALAAFSQHSPVYVQRGRHDFLLGETFAQRTGVQLLPDVHTFCLNDHSYALVSDALLLPATPFQHAYAQPDWHARFVQASVRERKTMLAQLPTFQAEPTQHSVLNKNAWSHLAHHHQAYRTLLTSTDLRILATIVDELPFSVLNTLTIPNWQQSMGKFLALTDQ